MERRDFLHWSAVAGATAAAGCAPGGLLQLDDPPGRLGHAAQVTHREVEDFVLRLDASMSDIAANHSQLGGLVPEAVARGELVGEQRRGDALLRGSLRSLLLTGSFADLPELAQVHPQVQKRMWQGLPEIDQSVSDMSAFLESLAPAERLDLARELRGDPQLVMRITANLDREATRLGVPLKRRLHFRTLMTQIAYRLRQQPPSAVMDEILGRVRKAQERPMTADSLQAYLSARMGEAAFWEYQGRLDTMAAYWAEGGGGGGAGLDAEAPRVVAQRPGRKLIITGAVLLGVGLVTSAVAGILMVAVNLLAGAFVMTPGALLFLSGLIVLLVGVSRGVKADPPTAASSAGPLVHT